MSDDFPRDERGLRACAWCAEPIRNQPATGRLRDYCSRTHRELAYRARREQAAIDAAVAAAVAAVSTTDGTDSSVVETPPPAPTPPRRLYAAGDRVRLLVDQAGSYVANGGRHEFRVPADTLGTIRGVQPYASPLPYVVDWDTGKSLSVAEEDLRPAEPRAPRTERRRISPADLFSQLPLTSE